MKLPKFLTGLLIGGLIGLLVWYWQKSTSAEDGALSVLDRLAASDKRVRDLEARLRSASSQDTAPPIAPQIADSDAGQPENDDLRAINGIGPTYARRLQEAGVTSYLALSRLTPARLMEITGTRSAQTAETWISAARQRTLG